MKKLAEEAGVSRDYHIESAATSTEEIGNPVYPPARRKLAEHGISCAGKTARQIRSAESSNISAERFKQKSSAVKTGSEGRQKNE